MRHSNNPNDRVRVHFLRSESEFTPSREGSAAAAVALDDPVRRRFPDMRCGSEFIAEALKQLETSAKFGALVICVDTFKAGDSSDAEKSADTRVAEILDRVRRTRDGIWGRLDTDCFGCFLPCAGLPATLQQAEAIQNELQRFNLQTVLIGAAVHPHKNFSKAQVLTNARKAIDHAAFFGPGSVAAFDAVTLNISGDRFYQAGRLAEAANEYRTALTLDPTNVNVYNSLGVCRAEMGDLEQALLCFDNARWLDDSDVMAVYNIGLVRLLQGRIPEARKLFLNAHEMDAGVFEVELQVGRLYLEDGDLSVARDFLQRAAELNPQSASAARLLGDCLARLGDDSAAVSAYQKAVKLNPNEAAALSGLGAAYDRLDKNLEIALVFCSKSVELSPDNGRYWRRLGRLQAKAGRLDEARQAFSNAAAEGCDCTAEIDALPAAAQKDLQN